MRPSFNDAMKSLTRSLACFFAVAVTSGHTSASAQMPDDSLKVYAVRVVKSLPLQKAITGDGIYLGKGLIITAAHVVGHWPLFTRPHVLIAGQNLPATVIKEGAFETIDLALLSVEEAKLPVSLQLRRNPICTGAPKVGMEVIDVDSISTKRALVISPLAIAPQLRAKFDTLIDSPEGSGSGLFDADRKCLVGIMSAETTKFVNQRTNGRLAFTASGSAGYFVPASAIAKFIPPDIHF
jgi:hypothetical protein